MYEKFERLLNEKGLTAYKVSKETGVTTTTLTNWKQGKYIPKPDKLQKIADYLGVSIDYLMGFDDNSEEKERLATLINNFGTKAISLIAKHCRSERINRDLTEKKVAAICNIDLNTYLSFESDHIDIGVDNIMKILSFFNTEINYLAGFCTGALINFENEEQITDILSALIALTEKGKEEEVKVINDNLSLIKENKETNNITDEETLIALKTKLQEIEKLLNKKGVE